MELVTKLWRRARGAGVCQVMDGRKAERLEQMSSGNLLSKVALLVIRIIPYAAPTIQVEQHSMPGGMMQVAAQATTRQA